MLKFKTYRPDEQIDEQSMSKSMRKSIFLTVLLLPLQILGSIPSFVQTPEISQRVLGVNGCGPTALFYALKEGAPELKKVYQSLPGQTDREKLKALTAQFGHQQSLVRPLETRFDLSRGMAVYDLFAMARDVLSSSSPQLLHALSLHRQPLETEAGSLLKRAYFTLKESLDRQIPVIANILPYVNSPKGNYWTEYRGHFIVITDIPSNIDEALLGFNFHYLDPESGKISEAQVREEVSENFSAREDFPNGLSEWIQPKVLYHGNQVSSPFLKISSSHINLVPPGAATQKVVMALTTVIGGFEMDRARVFTSPTHVGQ